MSLQLINGVHEVIYTAPAGVGGNAAATASYTVSDQHKDASASGAAIIGGNASYSETGSGATSVILGNGSDTVTLSGSRNAVSLGNGSDAVSGGAGQTTVSLGNGQDSVTLGGSGNQITAGNGSDVASASGQRARQHLGGWGGQHDLARIGQRTPCTAARATASS